VSIGLRWPGAPDLCTCIPSTDAENRAARGTHEASGGVRGQVPLTHFLQLARSQLPDKLTHPPTFTHPLTHPLTHSPTHTLTHSHTHTLTHSHTHAHTHTHKHTPTPPHTPWGPPHKNTHSRAHTYTQTHAQAKRLKRD
jgi:hypothetical protein